MSPLVLDPLFADPPAAAPVRDPVPAAAAKPLPERPKRSELELLEQLVRMPEVSLTPPDASVLLQRFAAVAQRSGGTNFEPTTLLSVRPDLAMLPIRHGGFAHLPDFRETVLGLQAPFQRIGKEPSVVTFVPQPEPDRCPHEVGVGRLFRAQERRRRQDDERLHRSVPELTSLRIHADRSHNPSPTSILRAISASRSRPPPFTSAVAQPV